MILIESKKYLTPVNWDYYPIGDERVIVVVGYWNELVSVFIYNKNMLNLIGVHGKEWTKTFEISNIKLKDSYHMLYKVFTRWKPYTDRL